ncbi:DNA internalization-related competence protein ComEC/Rec2 [Heliorestis convoluta]|uniref:DNA internalization-related competence protein ComEC/Rec2 n=1 Tax=Heliorestis convoluta TaxID=356322 RepID=A0A5Q2MYU9_9FIRM|nr:DNA internalization-related competence protein ComEC/Rec2 [Heliorestis convoluta]QGG47918.1 DNA internalization-related competence protein ComEC/Rec2 [Heliorestis convoluta]
MQRPLVVFVLYMAMGVAFGIAHGEYYRYPLSQDVIGLWLSLTIIAALLFYVGDAYLFPKQGHFLRPHKAMPARWLLYLLIFTMAWFYSYQQALIPSDLAEEENKAIYGKVVSVQERPTQLLFDLRRPDGEKIRVKYTGPPLPQEVVIGQALSLSGTIYVPSQRRNPGAFDYQAYLWRQGIAREMTLRSPESIRFLDSEDRNSLVMALGAKASSLRNQMISFIQNHGPPSASGVIGGIIFGGQEGLTEEDREVFRITGVAHAFAVSGTAVGVLAGTVMVLLRSGRQWRLPIWPSILITTTILFFYGFMTAFPPSVQRAVLMALGGLLAYGFQKKADPPTMMAAAAMAILLYNPLMLGDIGFQMSFAATWGILYFLPLFQQWLGGRNLPFYLKGPIAILALSLAAQLAVAPLTIYYFNLLSLSGFVANLVAGLFIATVITFGFAIFLLLFLWETGASYLLTSLALIVEITTYLLRKLSTIPGAALTVATPHPLLMVAYYLALIVSREVYLNNISPKVLASFQRALLPASAIILLLFLVPSLFTPATVKVTFIDVGQGDAIFIETPEGKRILIDTPGPVGYQRALGQETSKENQLLTALANRRPYDPGEKVVAAFFNHKGIGHIDLIINTHADQDHIGGLLYLVQNFSVGQLILSPPPKEVFTYEELKSIALDKKVPIWESPAPLSDISPDKRVALTVLYPGERSPQANINDSSIVLLLQHQNVHMLFTGDLEIEGQRELASLAKQGKVDLRAEVVKIPHHGSKFFDELFVKETEAQIAVITVGRNYFGHPSSEALEAWDSIGSTLLRTDLHGAVTIESNGRRIWYETVRFF